VQTQMLLSVYKGKHSSYGMARFIGAASGEDQKKALLWREKSASAAATMEHGPPCWATLEHEPDGFDSMG
jgi:hypothetical protein